MRFATRKTWNYLRVRGEYRSLAANICLCMELPPRARRILIQAIEQPFDCGTTSACAENTPRSHTRRGPSWNYLRVRGEYATSGFEEFWAAELPPRARRILLNASLWGWLMGTTSACAENTTWRCCCCWWCWNYLRVRGEYAAAAPTRTAVEGTTSACAENTRKSPSRAAATRNYLRVRGEYPK